MPDLQLLEQQRTLLSSKEPKLGNFGPIREYDEIGTLSWKKKGQILLKEGKIGCLLIAGGQATRLNFEGPKGTFPISLIRKKSLFQFFSEKIVAASRLFGHAFPLAIMTSPQNDAETRAFFEKHNFFGLENVSFFCQEQLPLLDAKGEVAGEGPDGNGAALSLFYRSGIWKEWQGQGIELVNFFLIDNPLADPLDPELIGYHTTQEAEVTIKATKRLSPDEKVGILVEETGKIAVKEYSETSENYPLANLSLFCFSMAFIEKIRDVSLPLHIAEKEYPQGKLYKFERFIFDLLPYSNRTKILVYPREKCFAPLKSLQDLEAVQSALLKYDKARFEEITGDSPPDSEIELAPEFYYVLKEPRELLSLNGYIVEKPE